MLGDTTKAGPLQKTFVMPGGHGRLVRQFAVPRQAESPAAVRWRRGRLRWPEESAMVENPRKMQIPRRFAPRNDSQFGFARWPRSSVRAKLRSPSKKKQMARRDSSSHKALLRLTAKEVTHGEARRSSPRNATTNSRSLPAAGRPHTVLTKRGWALFAKTLRAGGMTT